MQPREIVQAVAAKTGDIGGSFYFHPDTLARGKELNLDGFRFYFLGRGGVLGDVEPDVVLAAFGYFHPALVAKLWNSGKERIAPRDAARAYIECCHAVGRKRYASIDGLREYNAAATKVIGAADPGALPLFAGVRAEPCPQEVPALAAHQSMVLRELRGSAHLVAIRAVGLTTDVAHAIKRPNDLQSFGYSEAPTITDDHRRRHSDAERITDDILEAPFSVLDEDEAAALIAGTDAMHAAMATAG